MINNVTFNNIDLWEDLGVVLVSPPNYPIPSEIKETVHVKGANGSLTEATGYFKDITLDLKFRGLLNQGKILDFTEFKRRIFGLCNNILDDRLLFKDNPYRYYKVKSLGVGAITKISEYEVDFNIKFVCDPFLYNTQEPPITTQGNIQYNGDIPNAPIIEYIADGGGTSTINCNGDTLEFELSGGGAVAINNNPYSIVTLDGVPIKSKGRAPIFIKGTNNLTIETSYGWRGDLKIIKRERYLG